VSGLICNLAQVCAERGEEGAPCQFIEVFPTDCAAGLQCQNVAGSPLCTRPTAQVGDPCDPSTFSFCDGVTGASGLRCDAASSLCVDVNVVDDGACDDVSTFCEFTFVSRFCGADFTCHDLPRIGEPCTDRGACFSSANNLRPDAECDFSETVPTCKAVRELGQSCDPAQVRCAADEECGIDEGVCVVIDHSFCQ
jgi:hypothetical protein